MKFNTLRILLVCFVVLGGIYFIGAHFLKEEVVVLPVRKGQIRDTVTGNVKVLAEASYQLRAQSQGVVDWARLVPLGEVVKVAKNETLIQFVLDDLNRSIRLAEDAQFHHRKRVEVGSHLETELKIHEKELESFEILGEKKQVSPLDLEKKRNVVEKLKMQVLQEKISWDEMSVGHKANLENLHSMRDKLSVRSPIEGEFISCLVAPGKMVFAGDPLGEVASVGRMVEVSLNEEDFSGISVGLPAALSLFAFGQQVFDANVSVIMPRVDGSTGRRKLFLRVKQPKKFPIGASGHAEIIKSIRTNSLFVPRKALLGEAVFVVEKGIVKYRKVQVGARNLMTAEILEGLSEEELVIVETPHLFRDGQRVSVKSYSVID